MKKVEIYIETTIKGPVVKDGKYAAALVFTKSTGESEDRFVKPEYLAGNDPGIGEIYGSLQHYISHGQFLYKKYGRSRKPGKMEKSGVETYAGKRSAE